jgi:hypothetical protein
VITEHAKIPSVGVSSGESMSASRILELDSEEWTPEKINALVRENKKLISQLKAAKYVLGRLPLPLCPFPFPLPLSPFPLPLFPSTLYSAPSHNHNLTPTRAAAKEREAKLKSDMAIMSKFSNSEVGFFFFINFQKNCQIL